MPREPPTSIGGARATAGRRGVGCSSGCCSTPGGRSRRSRHGWRGPGRAGCCSTPTTPARTRCSCTRRTRTGTTSPTRSRGSSGCRPSGLAGGVRRGEGHGGGTRGVRRRDALLGPQGIRGGLRSPHIDLRVSAGPHDTTTPPPPRPRTPAPRRRGRSARPARRQPHSGSRPSPARWRCVTPLDGPRTPGLAHDRGSQLPSDGPEIVGWLSASNPGSPAILVKPVQRGSTRRTSKLKKGGTGGAATRTAARFCRRVHRPWYSGPYSIHLPRAALRASVCVQVPVVGRSLRQLSLSPLPDPSPKGRG